MTPVFFSAPRSSNMPASFGSTTAAALVDVNADGDRDLVFADKLGGQLEDLRIRGEALSAPANYAAE